MLKRTIPHACGQDRVGHHLLEWSVADHLVERGGPQAAMGIARDRDPRDRVGANRGRERAAHWHRKTGVFEVFRLYGRGDSWQTDAEFGKPGQNPLHAVGISD
ncbi:hypothetical protein A2501_04060 [Candidatus Uhrbacteria bacterium RIFOXYC12_FULL_57_11]|nr:MAG: hypothetical protein A2501_04060 [Candidatus Uhrbacteria bacterium RIFOXYC12_FULL_57_11]